MSHQYSDQATCVLLAGVGGQGAILAAGVLAQTAIAHGLEVKLSEIHGMAQRGGSVVTVVRFGEQVNSMVCDEGSADYLLAFETTEALRCLPYLSKTGHLLVNDETIKPLTVLAGRAEMPRKVRPRLKEHGAVIVKAGQLALQAGSVKCANVVLLGALAAHMPFERKVWEEVIARMVPPKTIEMNLDAFARGYEAGSSEDL